MKTTILVLVPLFVLAAGLFLWRYNINGIRPGPGDSEESYYYVHGRIAREKSGLVYSDGELWYLDHGRLDTEYTGFAPSASGTWYVADGKAQADLTGLYYGTVLREYLEEPGTECAQFVKFLIAEWEDCAGTGWWYVKEGRVCFVQTLIRQEAGLFSASCEQMALSFGSGETENSGTENTEGETGSDSSENTQSVQAQNAGQKNQTEEEETTVVLETERNVGNAGVSSAAAEIIRWCYVDGGMLNPAYEGIAQNENGKFFVSGGSVDFKVEGTWLQEGCTYILENGTVVGEITSESTKFIAHRGLSAEAPENTVRAFILAGEAGFWGCEADVRLTADSRFVILHNKTFKKMCGEALYPGDLSTEEIEALTVIYGSNLEEYASDPLATSICFLEDFLAVCVEYNMVPVIDIKEESTTDAAADTERIRLLYETTLTCIGDREVVFIAFDLDLLILLRQFAEADGNGNVRLQYLTRDSAEVDISVYQAWGIELDLDYEYLEEDTISVFQASGIEVNLWTLDDVLTVFSLLQQGADYITTDCRYW